MAGSLFLNCSTDKAPVSYLSGEPITFEVQLLDDGKPIAGKTLKWLRTGDDQRTADGEGTTSESQPLKITTSLDKPGFVRLQVSVFDKDGSPLQDTNNKPLHFEGGAGVEVAKLEGYPEPADFDAFWKAQKSRLAEVPMAAHLTKVPSQNPMFQVFDVKVDCPGGKPVSGYLSIPNDAKEKSLSAQLSFRGYSVTGADQEFHNGALVFQINAHGIENGRGPEYYQGLNEDALKKYGFDTNENAKPETSYFSGMMLRVLRAIEYVKSRPEWNGKTLVAFGGSQGGLQAITAAALDGSVTKCVALKPWCCDLGGIKLGRLSGWRPAYADGLGYYDAANMAKRVKCEVFLTSGLGDYTCPPSGVSVLYNNLKAPKTIEYSQGATHGYSPPNAIKQTIQGKSQLGKLKVVQCWDDSLTTDMPLIALLKKRQAKATFNIIPRETRNAFVVKKLKAGKHVCFSFVPPEVGREGGFKVEHLANSEMPEAYRGFKIAAHCYIPLGDTPQDSEARMRTLLKTKAMIRDDFGQPVCGFVYPGGRYTPAAMADIKKAGYLYARTTKNSHAPLPLDQPMALPSSCHWASPDFWERYDEAKKNGGVFYFWGHSCELGDDPELWDWLDSIYARISADSEAEWADVIDLFDKADPAPAR